MKRRRQGAGSLIKNGRLWWMQFYQNGERMRESTGCEDRAQAEAVLKRRLLEIGRLEAFGVAPGHATIADLYELVAADHSIKRLKDGSPRWRWGKHIEKRWAKVQASRLTSGHIAAYIAERRREGAADATINRELAVVRHGYTLGRQVDPPLVIAAPHFPTLKEDNVRQGFLEPDEYERLLEKMPPRMKALFVCAYHVGTRRNELRKTRWEQVDWGAGMIRIPGAMTKNGQPRTLPVYGDMRKWLDRQREECPEENPFVFFGRYKRPVSEDPGRNGWRAACEAAGFPGLLLHDMRRSAARNMRRAGVDQQTAKRITGHLTDSMYQRYDIIDEHDLADAGRKLEDYHQQRKKARAARLKAVK